MAKEFGNGEQMSFHCELQAKKAGL